MGLISKVFSGAEAARQLGDAAKGVAEVFTPNATREMELDHAAYTAALAQHGGEFAAIRIGWFDKIMNGLNRLPRPMLALGTLGLFIYAMVDPAGFSTRMTGLAYVPDPLWWLLGAIVSFYFGARELHYRRTPRNTTAPVHSAWIAPRPSERAVQNNPALNAWNDL